MPSYLYFIKEGKVKVYKTNEDGKELVTAIYTTGEFIGYTAIIEDEMYKESAETMDECVIAKIPAKHFKGLLNTNIEVMQKFVQLLASNVSERERQLLELAYSSLRKKVSSALISIYRKFKGDGHEPGAIRINRENLANFTGTAKESVIRTLSDFKDEKLIDIREGQIVILNEQKLMGMLN
jgi:CRP-like cAMP-binding protein